MPGLLDLPNEILRSTLEWVSEDDHSTLFKAATVNKRLNVLATPLLVRSWKSDWTSSLDLFLLHLLRHPEYRKEIRHLDIYPFTAEDHSRENHVASKITSSESEEITAAAAEAWPELAENTTFVEQVRCGVHDALLVLLLAWATNLRTLRLTVPYFDPGNGEDLFTLMWMGQVVRKMRPVHETAWDNLPLLRLESVRFEHWDTENFVEHGLAAPFFYLPRMKSFSSCLMGSDDREDKSFWSQEHDQWLTWSQQFEQYLTTFPVGTSGIESIDLGEADISLTGLSDLLQACCGLTSLSWDLASLLTNDTVSSNGIARLLMYHAKSLKKLSFRWDEPPHFYTPENPADGPTTLENCFQYLECLEDLTAPGVGFYSNGANETT